MELIFIHFGNIINQIIKKKLLCIKIAFLKRNWGMNGSTPEDFTNTFSEVIDIQRIAPEMLLVKL